MPTLYLSPSTQEFNPYISTGNEEYWMNQIADKMEPYLLASGIEFTRNDPAKNAAAAIRESNAGDYDLHLALHSNAAPLGAEGTYRGIDAYFAPGSLDGMRAAEIIVDNLKMIYPLKDRVQALPTMSLGEVRRTKAPAVLVELGYHDNWEDAIWIEENQDAIARALVLSVTEYFGVPFLTPERTRQGLVSVQWGRLNIRALPTTNSEILAQAENNEPLIIFGESGNWYSVQYKDVVGYANAAYVIVQEPRGE